MQYAHILMWFIRSHSFSSFVVSRWLYLKVPATFLFMSPSLLHHFLKLCADVRLMRCAQCSSITTRELAAR